MFFWGAGAAAGSAAKELLTIETATIITTNRFDLVICILLS
jgi:hypothetical protein